MLGIIIWNAARSKKLSVFLGISGFLPQWAGDFGPNLGLAGLTLGKVKNIIPNGGLMVMNSMVQGKKSP